MSLLQLQAEKSGWDSPLPTSFPKLPPSISSPKMSSLCSSPHLYCARKHLPLSAKPAYRMLQFCCYSSFPAVQAVR